MRILAALIAFGVLSGLSAVQPMTGMAQAVPDPSKCQVEPRADDWIMALLATPVAIEASPAPLPATPVPADALPEGEPAGPDVLFGINETMREIVACVNAGDFPRALALLTDDAKHVTAITLFGVQVLELDKTATPTPLPTDEQTPFFSIRDPRVLPDGRVGAIVSDDSRPDYAWFIIFEEQDGRWLIDEAFPTEAGGAAGP